MYRGKSVLALIPARGGSKGLPGKNIRLLLGKPLISWSIEQALGSRYIDKVVVSTDSTKITGIARHYGAEVPFRRPKKLASDNAKSMDVILHAINFYESRGHIFDIIVFLEPTSPLREIEDIDKAIEILMTNQKAESIVGVAKLESAHPEFLVKLKKGFLEPYLNKAYKVFRRQEVEELYFFEGSLYIAYAESLKNKKTFYHNKTLAYIVPKWKSFEMDDYTDFIIIEAILRARRRGVKIYD
ncbi:MAG: acylneuraminate cytidylyltransferase family protein [Candidatus Omnitrophica bacterium]|nr:acylneuraminate cytidylyltransferase family protein [Candidatus Omnitrophota bacterium]